MLEDVGPGTERLLRARAGDGLGVTGPLGLGFAAPADGRRALLCGGGVGTAPLAIWQDELLAPRRRRRPRCSASATPTHAAGAALLHNARVATDDGSHGHHGLVTDLLAAELDADAARGRLRLRPAADARGGAGAVRRARRPGPARARGRHGVRLRRLLRLRRAAARGRLRAPLRRRPGPRRAPCSRRCRRIDARSSSAASRLAHPIVNGSGTFDAIAARRAFGDALLEHFPFSAFVSKTITLAPRDGNPPPRLCETPAGMINSIGLPNKGLRGYLEQDLPGARAAAGAARSRTSWARPRPSSCALVEALDARDEVDAIELNVSCPNVDDRPRHRRRPRSSSAAVMREVRPRTAKPLIVKLTPEHRRRRRRRRRPRRRPAPTPSRSSTRCVPMRRIPAAPAARRGWAAGPAGCRARRSARSRSRRCARSPRASRSRSSAWAACRAAYTPRDMLDGGRDAGRRRHRELPRSGGGHTDLHASLTICSQRAGTTVG